MLVQLVQLPWSARFLTDRAEPEFFFLPLRCPVVSAPKVLT